MAVNFMRKFQSISTSCSHLLSSGTKSTAPLMATAATPLHVACQRCRRNEQRRGGLQEPIIQSRVLGDAFAEGPALEVDGECRDLLTE